MKMTVGEKVKLIMGRKGISVTELSSATGQTRQNLSNKFSRDNFSEKEIEAIADALGCTVTIQFMDKQTGESI